jgi:hypothetical protein
VHSHVYTGMRDIASEVRAAAATAVGELASNTGNARVISGLIALFEDTDWTVRSSALTVCCHPYIHTPHIRYHSRMIQNMRAERLHVYTCVKVQL